MIYVNHNCNRSCSYCESHSLSHPLPSLNEEALSHLKKIFSFFKKHGMTLDITGGEPGLLSVKFYDKLFSVIPNKSSVIYTDGLFINNGYADRYKDKIIKYVVHIIEGEDIYYPKYNHNCTYVYVVTKQNINSLIYIFNRYKYLNIHLWAYAASRISQKNESYSLDIDDVRKIEKICDSVPNLVSPIYGKSLDSLKVEPDHIIEEKIKLCKRVVSGMDIDLVYNTLRHCSNSDNCYMNITYDNFISMYNDRTGKYVNDIDCDNCYLVRRVDGMNAKKLVTRFLERSLI